MAKQIRKQAKAPKKDYRAEIREIDGQIDNVVQSLAAVGSSQALTDKLSELEAEKERLTALRPAPTQMVTGAERKWKEVISDLGNLKDYAKPDEVETARGLLREIVGEVVVKETGDGTWAIPCLSTDSVYIYGAQGET